MTDKDRQKEWGDWLLTRLEQEQAQRIEAEKLLMKVLRDPWYLKSYFANPIYKYFREKQL